MQILTTFNFDNLMASDVTGHARAFDSLVKGGLDVAEIAPLTGLLTSKEE